MRACSAASAPTATVPAAASGRTPAEELKPLDVLTQRHP